MSGVRLSDVNLPKCASLLLFCIAPTFIATATAKLVRLFISYTKFHGELAKTKKANRKETDEAGVGI